MRSICLRVHRRWLSVSVLLGVIGVMVGWHRHAANPNSTTARLTPPPADLQTLARPSPTPPTTPSAAAAHRQASTRANQGRPPTSAPTDPEPGPDTAAADQPAELVALNRSAASVAGSPRHAQIRGHPAHPTRLLARFKDDANDAQRQEPLGVLGLKLLRSDPLATSSVVLDSQDPEPPSPETDPQVLGDALERRISSLLAFGRFEYVEPDYEVRICRVPEDGSFTDGSLWGLQNSGQDEGLAGLDVGVVAAWDLTTGDTNVMVAVTDTGVRYTHQDLAAQMWRNPGEIPGNNLDDDAYAHLSGTSMATPTWPASPRCSGRASPTLRCGRFATACSTAPSRPRACSRAPGPAGG